MDRAEPRRGPSVLVLASTFPTHAQDPVPAFVHDQVVALSEEYPELVIRVVAPHDRRSATQDRTRHAGFEEIRFHYFWPRSGEVLAGRGIMPALQRNPWLYVAVPFLFLGEFVTALREARRTRPVVVYAHWFTPQAIVASWVSRLTGIPFVFTTHASDVDVWHRLPVLGRLVVRSTLRRAAAASAVSSQTLARLRRFDEDDTCGVPIHIIPMGTNLPARVHDGTIRERARARIQAAPDEQVLLFVGRLVEKKGLPYLLDALAAVRDDLGTWRLVVVGDGPLLDELVALADALGLADRVTFAGYATGEDKEAWYRAADTLVVPSVVASNGDMEGLPVVLLEGLSYGLPCIATRQSGADDILQDGRTGLLVEQRDAAGLAAALVRLTAMPPEQREQLALRGLELSHEFSWERLAKRHYEALVAPFITRTDAGL